MIKWLFFYDLLKLLEKYHYSCFKILYSFLIISCLFKKSVSIKDNTWHWSPLSSMTVIKSPVMCEKCRSMSLNTFIGKISIHVFGWLRHELRHALDDKKFKKCIGKKLYSNDVEHLKKELSNLSSLTCGSFLRQSIVVSQSSTTRSFEILTHQISYHREVDAFRLQ